MTVAGIKLDLIFYLFFKGTLTLFSTAIVVKYCVKFQLSANYFLQLLIRWIIEMEAYLTRVAMFALVMLLASFTQQY